MQNLTLEEKIKYTALLSEEEKDYFLTNFKTFSEPQKEVLGSSLDDFYETTVSLLKNYKLEIAPILEKLKQQGGENKKLAEELEIELEKLTNTKSDLEILTKQN